jgi:hypothetical protein
MITHITQIVPTLPPKIDGLGDYALNLARQLRRDWQIETHFIVGDPAWIGDRDPEFETQAIAHRSASALLSVLRRDRPILLHYSGYGYARRGCPQWLITALNRYQDSHLVTMFHEVYTYDCGPFWTSSFWLSPLQKRIATQLIQRCDRSLTSRENYVRLLQKISHQANLKITVLPVFSNLGEPTNLRPLSQRQRRLIVFGHRNTRLRTYTEHLRQLQHICKALSLAEIYDIGQPTGLNLSAICPCPVVEIGVASTTQISQIMQDAIAGFLSVPPPEYLGKSTIFAAYCAHGLIPILPEASSTSIDGLTPYQHYWVAQPQFDTCQDKFAIAKSAQTWYCQHNLAVQARQFARHLIP